MFTGTGKSKCVISVKIKDKLMTMSKNLLEDKPPFSVQSTISSLDMPFYTAFANYTRY
jgi:hypothetical protein